MKIVRIAIFLTGITGLLMGGIMTLSSLRSGQEEAVIRTNESLKNEATQFVDQFFGVLEATRNLPPNAVTVPSYVTNRAILKLDSGKLGEFESFISTDATVPTNAAQTDFGLQERVLTALKSEFSFPELKISRISMGTYTLSDIGNKEGIYIATPIYKVQNGVTDPNVIEKMNLTLIDPVKAFGGLQKISGSDDSSAYLITRQGKVLAHTLAAYVGTDLKKIDSLKGSIDHLFLGAQTGSVGKYTSVDGVPEQVAFVRAGSSPFAFAVEARARPKVLTGAWVSEEVESGAARRGIGLMFVVIAGALLAFSGISYWASKQLNEQISQNSRERFKSDPGLSDLPALQAAKAQIQAQFKSADTSTKFRPDFSPQNLAAAQSAASLVEARDQIALEKQQLEAAVQGLSAPRDFTRDFVSKIEHAYTLEAVEKELVKLSSEVSESPVLYFRYHRRNQALTLSSVAGEVKIPNYTHMQAYVRKDIELQVEQMADGGKVASISNYGPMSKLIITHLNVAHFEAWAVTSHPEVSGQSKFMGVLVILQAGTKSAQARPLLARILKEAGNYLYAQANKLKPRSSLYQTGPSNPRLEDSKFT